MNWDAEFSEIMTQLENGCEIIDDADFDKLKCKLLPGAKVGWYYQDDLDYWQECFGGDEFDPERGSQWRGILVPISGLENNGGEFEFDQMIVVMTSHPCEKCYPETGWMSLPSLMSDVVEIYEIKD